MNADYFPRQSKRHEANQNPKDYLFIAGDGKNLNMTIGGENYSLLFSVNEVRRMGRLLDSHFSAMTQPNAKNAMSDELSQVLDNDKIILKILSSKNSKSSFINKEPVSLQFILSQTYSHQSGSIALEIQSLSMSHPGYGMSFFLLLNSSGEGQYDELNPYIFDLNIFQITFSELITKTLPSNISESKKNKKDNRHKSPNNRKIGAEKLSKWFIECSLRSLINELSAGLLSNSQQGGNQYQSIRVKIQEESEGGLTKFLPNHPLVSKNLRFALLPTEQRNK